MIPGAVPKTKDYAQEIVDLGNPLSRERAAELESDLRETLAKDILPKDYRIHCTSLLGSLLSRLDRDAESLEYLASVAEMLDDDAVAWGNLGGVYVELEKVEEGRDALLKAVSFLHSKQSSRDKVVVLGNLAVAFWKNGQVQQALEAMQAAVEAADPQDSFDMHALAAQMAIMDMHVEAVEYLARSFALRVGDELGSESATSAILRLCPDYANAVGHTPKLLDSVVFLMAFDHAVQNQETPEFIDSEAAVEMLNATRPMRERATSAIVALGQVSS